MLRPSFVGSFVNVTYMLIYALGVDDYVVDVDEARFQFETS